MHPMRWPVLAMLVLVVSMPGVGAEEPLLLFEGADGLLELEGERRLEVSGFQGSVLVRPGKVGQLRFAARDPGDRDAGRPVALWLDGTTLRLEPLAKAPRTALRLEVAVAPRLETHLDLADAKIQLSGLRGDTRVRGERIQLTGQLFEGSLELDLHQATVRVSGVAEGLEVEGESVRGQIDGASRVSLQLVGGELSVNQVFGELDGDVEDLALTAAGVAGRIRLGTSGGTLGIESCGEGAELDLAETPLTLRDTKGTIVVETDSEVSFEQHVGALRIRATNAAVRGSNASGGELDVETRGAQVVLENLGGPTNLRGDNLEVRATGCKAELSVRTVYSSIVVDGAEQAVTVENEFGDVEVREAMQLVEVRSRDGSVHLQGLRAQALVDADGPEVQVHWSGLSGTETSTIDNAGGDVRVTLPTNLRCLVDLEAPRGRVETDIDELSLSDDGHSAAGSLLGGGRPLPYVKRPTIRVRAGGDLYFNTASPPQSDAAGGQ